MPCCSEFTRQNFDVNIRSIADNIWELEDFSVVTAISSCRDDSIAALYVQLHLSSAEGRTPSETRRDATRSDLRFAYLLQAAGGMWPRRREDGHQKNLQNPARMMDIGHHTGEVNMMWNSTSIETDCLPKEVSSQSNLPCMWWRIQWYVSNVAT